MNKNTEILSVGTEVKWQSQSSGYRKVKTGIIIEVVFEHRAPNAEHAQYGLKETGMPRAHVSYIVHVPGATTRSKGKRYWPLVSKLQKVTP